MQVFFPLTDDTYVQLIDSCLMPDGGRMNAHVYVLTPCDNIDYSASIRARLHNRAPTCQICLRKLANNDDDNLVHCGRVECVNPDAAYLIMETSDGDGQVADVAAGGNAAASSPTPPDYGNDPTWDVDYGDGDESPPETPVAGSLTLSITPASAESNARVQEALAEVQNRQRREADFPHYAPRDLTVVPLTDAETRALQDRMHNFINTHAPGLPEAAERMNEPVPKFKARPTTMPTPKAKHFGAGRGTFLADTGAAVDLTEARQAELGGPPLSRGCA